LNALAASTTDHGLLALALALAFVAGALGTWGMRRYALQRQLLDHPNERSSHALPTPRGGGMAIVGTVLLGLTAWAVWQPSARGLWVALVPPGLAVAAVGFLDDHGHVPARWRLLVHFGAAAWATFALGSVPALQLGEWRWQWGVLGLPVSVLLAVWLLNLYNFMDGIDGIAGAEAVFVGVAAAALMGPDSPIAVALLLLAAASAGFLVFNWPPARIFMGDVGSGFVGLMLAVLLIGADAQGLLPIWSGMILMGVFVVDATVTLLRRLARGERVHEAHRSHAYQWSARRFGRHRPVTVATVVIDVGWLLPWAWWAAQSPRNGLPAAAAALLPLAALAFWLGAGRAETSTPAAAGTGPRA